jgi:two-component system, cell cycle sensor histidine kinase and response regulator CckA
MLWQLSLQTGFTVHAEYSMVKKELFATADRGDFHPAQEASAPLAGGVSLCPPAVKRNSMAQRSVTEAGPALGAAQLGILLDAVQELVAVLSSDGTLQFVNGAFEKVLGYRADQLLGQNLHKFVLPVDEGVLQGGLNEIQSLADARYTDHCRFRCADGGWRWMQFRCQNLLDNGLAGILFHAKDVTDVHRMESERQVNSEVVHALNETSNLDQLLTRIHEALKQILPAENFFVALHEPITDTFHFPFLVDEYDTAPPPQKVGRSCTAYVFRTGEAKLIPQSDFDRLAAAGEVELVGSASPAWLGVPLKTPTATIGVLVMQHYQDENAYDQRDLEFMESVGGHIALAIERRRSEEELRRNESILRSLFEQNPLPIWLYEIETLKFLRVNQAAVELYGYSAEEFTKLTIAEIRPESQRKVAHEAAKRPGEREFWLHQAKGGRTFEVELISHLLDYDGKQVALVVAQDISERRHLESQLRQAQKMEAVGRLAGGVAHDFNNLLMVIKGHTELLLNSLDRTDQTARKIEQIDKSADRASALTRQLLAFSRRQVLQPEVMSINSTVEEMGKLLPRLIGEDIELIIRTDKNVDSIRADSSQMEQVLMNLAVNARDAMPNGGKLVIETCNANIDASYVATHPLMKPGQYVQLVVTDSGTGMDSETQAHIFEPFFTTKEKGKGTGLGLAMVYGIVKQSGGFIWVYSELGKGTSFKIYLPRVGQTEEHAATPRPALELPMGTETVLLTEDENDVREIARQFLESGGYRVIEAKNGAEAIKLAAAHRGDIQLLVTDMIMPGMTGQELAARLQAEQPGLNVVFMSGYSEHAATEMADVDPSVRLLTKPFSRAAILRAVGEILRGVAKQ